MRKNKDDELVTRKILQETLVETLGNYTEGTLLPAVDRMMDEKLDHRLGELKTELNTAVDKKLGALKTDLKDHTDRRATELRGDMVSIMKTGKDKDQRFKHKMVQIVRRNKLAPAGDIAVLEQLAQ